MFRGAKYGSDSVSDEIRNRCVAIVGMNATGKSNFGRALASALHMKRCDIDAAFVRQYGAIQAFIEKEGNEKYRKYEEELVLRSIQPGYVLVLSGGAIESEAVRKSLAKNAAVIWIRAGKKRVMRNISNAKRERHEFVGKDVRKTAEDLLAIRDPLYREVADITLAERVRYSQYIPVAIRELRTFHGHEPSVSESQNKCS
ncbi:hypothetical protein COU78_01335 [Candidatus Peregrinibacteria bacterium CG10_big_fil_rev_8_21_14_0_10_49_24]|nr:MAG: hypothetical protein COV83_04300 [Candidatus Peregrinibacteria bacterium CG11_big_fil_rev_8_21_14_0_20_49_14]PIR51368.1 MAG: hypothetical protein COU78_01335 [Candidatus Peregrinibacteria bacterium CG10_big_fil_rev_8_21_14_0_10_49_24]PJA68132.1 MAG: hypothetical protein CO157_01150 [Candidatus Peregrinibacteria bacterium CG_4_9_14_3_um_filter_49_12]